MGARRGKLSKQTLQRLQGIGYDVLKGPVSLAALLNQLKPEDDILVVNSEHDQPAASQEFPISRLHRGDVIPQAGTQFMTVVGPTGKRHFQTRRDQAEWRDVHILDSGKPLHIGFSSLKFSVAGKEFTEISNIRDIYIFRSSVVDAAAEAAFSG